VSTVAATKFVVTKNASPVGAINQRYQWTAIHIFQPHIQHFITSISGLSLPNLAVSQLKPHNSEILKLLTAVANLILTPQNYYYNLL